jgi:hypothetical protein
MEEDLEKVECSNAELQFPLLPEIEVEETLVHFLFQNKNVPNFFKFTASFWNSTSNDNTFWSKIHQMLFVVVRFLIVLTAVGAFYYFSLELSRGDIIGILIGATIFLDALSVLPAQYQNQKRLCLPVVDPLPIFLSADRTEVVNQSLHVANLYIVVSLFTIMFSIFSGTVTGQRAVIIAAMTVAEVCIVLYLGFNLFFLVLDAKVSVHLVQQLREAASCNSLTMESFCNARALIHTMVQQSRWASDFIAAPCVASTISIVVLVFHFDPTDKTTVYFCFGWILALIKEMMFICVAFWFVSQVNSAADLLTVELSSLNWPADSGGSGGRTRPEEPTGSPKISTATKTRSSFEYVSSVPLSSTGLAGAETQQNFNCHTEPADRIPSLPSVQMTHLSGHKNSHMYSVRDIERLSIHASCISEPISFNLLFKRVSWQNILWSAFGVSFSIFVGLIRIAFT